jgi:tetratricopeptide (TPR) repeat protein
MEIVFRAIAEYPEADIVHSDADALRIGQRLANQMIVAGSFQRLGTQLRIDARILSIALNRALPMQPINVTVSYPENYSEALNQLAERVIAALQVPVNSQESASLKETLQSTRSAQAYQFYLRGVQQMRNGTAEALAQAIQWFGQALNQDSNYSLAYAAKAEAEARLAELKQAAGQDTRRLGEEAVHDGLQAVTRAPNIGKNHLALARAHSAVGNYEAAASEARQATRLWPSDAVAYERLARALSYGKLTSNVELKRALQLQPGLALILPESLNLSPFVGDQSGRNT